MFADQYSVCMAPGPDAFSMGYQFNKPQVFDQSERAYYLSYFNNITIYQYTSHIAIFPLIAKILPLKIQYFKSPLCVLNSYWCYGLNYLPQHDF